MTDQNFDFSSLVKSDAPGQWSEAAVWAVFCRIIANNSPLPGLNIALNEFYDIFKKVYSKIKSEHSYSFWQYYRTTNGVPLVNPINVEHLTRLLHAFSNRLYKLNAPETILDCLFYSMRTHCNINLFYRTQEIDFLFPLHAMSSVIGDGEYGEFIAITQHCTIGQNHGKYPSIHGDLWMGPGSSILGSSKIGSNVRVAAHAFIIDRDIPNDVVVYGSGSELIFKDNPQNNRKLILDNGLLDTK